MIDAARSRRTQQQEPYFEVWEENWAALLFFLRVSTQWNVVAGLGGIQYIGLRHEAIESDMRMARISVKDRHSLQDDLIIIERAALKILNKVEG